MTPWGKMRAMGELTANAASTDTTRGDVAWACSQCLRCRTLCLLDNPVADTLSDGRSDLYDRGQAPVPVRDFVARWPERMQKLARAAEGIHSDPRASVAFVPGCTRVVTQTDTVQNLARVVGALTQSPDDRVRVIADGCCGAPLHDAGDRKGFETHARQFARALDGASRIVVSDAGCAYTLRRTYPLYGIALGTVEHISETADRALDRLRPVSDARAVRYHDACKLGRGLGVYEAPRRVLRALRGVDALEMMHGREHASCSGGGGLLPVSSPDTAGAITAELADEARRSGEDAVVVTGCATTRNRLARQGIAAEDIADWIARGV